jgi:hypothetical protein
MPASVRSAPRTQLRGTLMEEDRVDALHPGGVLGPKIVIQLE